MANYPIVIIFSLIGGLFSLLGGLLILQNKSIAERLARYAAPFAAGAMLSAVFLDLLKEGIAEASADQVLFFALAGVILFFFAERYIRWFHHHHHHEGETDPAVPLIIIGDTLHNAIDGVVIAAAFLVDVQVGIVTTLAVAAHEIPQEVGDFGLLLSKGLSRKRVLLVNVFSALATTVMAVLTFAVGSQEQLPVGALLGLSAGFLLYIATSDIIPDIHANAQHKKLFDVQPILLLLGAVTVGVVTSLLGV